MHNQSYVYIDGKLNNDTICSSNEGFEIIGNIYENPELLKP